MQNQKLHYAELIKEIIILTVAVAIIAAAVFFFLVPSHTSVSSISGLGIVLSNFIPLPLSAITMILNASQPSHTDHHFLRSYLQVQENPNRHKNRNRQHKDPFLWHNNCSGRLHEHRKQPGLHDQHSHWLLSRRDTLDSVPKQPHC